MYIERIPNRTSPPAVLLRESFRQDGKVKKRTIANLSSLADDVVDGFAALLRGEKLVPVDSLHRTYRSLPTGHVDAVVRMMQRLGVARLVGGSAGPEANLIQALIVQRILQPSSKLGATRLWEESTLGQAFGISNVDVDDVYRALDWLVARQSLIEAKLAKRHLSDGDLALYDLSSAWYTGSHCDLARRGYSRDGKKGSLQVNFGLLTNRLGCPVSISVFPGNTGDSSTVEPQLRKLRKDFKLSQVVFVGDRGMVTGKQIAAMREHDAFRWVTALRSADIKKLVEGDYLQLELFDETNLFALTHQDYPNERLIACRNPALAERRGKSRNELLAATCANLDKIAARVASGKLVDAGEIGVAAGKVIDRRKMGKHIRLHIEDGRFGYEVDQDAVAREATLDGIYVIRTSVAEQDLDDASAVRAYKALTNVERDFRSIKSVDIEVRPIFHRTEARLKAHFLVCMLARYVLWHLERAWRPMTFADESPQSQPDPVLPRERSLAAKEKATRRGDDNGAIVHSHKTLVAHLATQVRNFGRITLPNGAIVETVADTDPTPVQRRARQLIEDLAL